MNPLSCFSAFFSPFSVQIKSLQYRIQHESINLTEEKKIIREIKQLEGTRDKVIANAAIRAEIQKSVGEKDSIQDQVKVRTLIPKAYIGAFWSFSVHQLWNW